MVRLSPEFLARDGLAEFYGRYESWLNLLHRDDLPHLTDLLDRAFHSRSLEAVAEFRIVVPTEGATKSIEGRYAIVYDVEGKPIRVFGVNLDVTERKRAIRRIETFAKTMEEQAKERSRALEADSEARRRADASLRQMQRMEAVGQLTGGVAHDFNNLLTIILGGLDIIGAHIPSIGASAAATRITRGRDMAMQGARRAATLTQRLLAFSRQQPLEPKPLDPNKLVAGMSEFLRRTLGETVALESVLAAGLWKTYIDAGQLENAILNLAVNARDAMPNGGKLTIETANSHLDEAYVSALSEPLKPGQYILIAVADTGGGMTKSILERVFEPFFTTKEIGKGTGLGLSQVYGFVRQSNGHVKIYSEVDEGTTVKIYLPRYLGSGADETELDTMDSAPTSVGAETILVVEDDDALREYTVEILTDLGYHVLAASGAAMALEILDRVDDVDLLFTDIVMPGGANGRELADEALHRKSDLKVLFTTGYTRNAIVHHGRLDQGVQMIGKPFSLDQLAAKVRAMLSEC
jgi:signal transduction histidine kinase